MGPCFYNLMSRNQVSTAHLVQECWAWEQVDILVPKRPAMGPLSPVKCFFKMEEWQE